MRITAAGLEIVLSGAPTEAARAAVAAAQADEARTFVAYRVPASTGPVPISFRVVAHSRAVLNGLTAQLTADAHRWNARGIALSSWGPDLSSDKVLVHLLHYSAAAAHELEAGYGALVQVAIGSQGASASDQGPASAP
jgi:hypothetical protein